MSIEYNLRLESIVSDPSTKEKSPLLLCWNPCRMCVLRCPRSRPIRLRWRCEISQWRHLVLRLQMIIQLIIPRKTPHSITRTATNRAVMFLGTILVLLRVASEVRGVLDGDVAAWVRAVVPLAGRGRAGITVSRWSVAR